MLAWAGGLALLSGVLSASAKSAATLFESTPQIGRMFTLVGAGTEPSDVFLSAIMGMFGLLAGAYAVQATLRLRTEEAGSLVEPLLAGPVSRTRWAASHLVFALLGPAVAMAAAGVAAGLVYGIAVGDVPGELPRVLAGAMVQVPAVWLLVGITMALFGLWPRLAAGGWAAFAPLVLLWTIAMSVELNQAVLDLSPFNHVPKLPGGDMTATPLLWLVAATAAFVGVGLVGFRRRDVVGA